MVAFEWKDKMKISIILTIYNSIDSVKPMFDSFLNNNVFDTEVVIVDAGSNDGTIEAIQSFSHKMPKN